MKKNNLKSSVFSAVLLSVIGLNGCAVPQNPFKSEADKAILSWSKGNHEQAIHHSQRALKKNPDDAYSMMIAGLSYERLGYPDRAKPFFEQVKMSDSVDIGVFGSMKNVPDEGLKRAAERRITDLTVKEPPFVTVDPYTHIATFSKKAVTQSPAVPFVATNSVYIAEVVDPVLAQAVIVSDDVQPAKGGLDMLKQSDLNLIMRFVTFQQLRDEKYVTQDEWDERRSVNLGGILTYTLPPAAKGMDLPAPSSEKIIERLNALRQALEMRAITPREHAAEREIILEALLPVNPFYRMDYTVPVQDILEAATALRRVETLARLKIITPAEAAKETKAIEKHVYQKLGVKVDKKTMKKKK